MIASLERSSSSEGGQIHRIRTNGIQRLIHQLKNNRIPRPIPIHPTRLSVHVPRGEQSIIDSRSPLPALVLVVVLLPIRGKSQTHGQKEKKPSNHPTKPASCLTHPYLHQSTPAQARTPHSSLQDHHSLQPQWTQQDSTSSDTAMRLYLYLPLLQVPDLPLVPFQSRWA